MHELRARLQRYGLAGTLRLALDWLRTRFLYPDARLIRSPFRVRGRASVDFGEDLTTGVGVRIDAFCAARHVAVRFGRRVQVNDHVHIAAVQEVAIGDDVLIASRVFISDHQHGCYSHPDPASAPTVAPAARPLQVRPVRIGDRVWIGEQVCILPGVRIGDGAIVGAGAVVTRDVAENTIVAGNPARPIRRYDADTGVWVRV